ncbi:FecR family protein [Chitinophaga sp. 22321]|uniref:FecR domain-containing protein n=1 Tax=Chitinophaga hostae TaxID=2831022 RepID=A0ABS5J619_9BACT|nr:FecR domain-containing protein [Chitinophaga hostae]MBS0030665.1 FecR domain-containing protein [Chitinophaga hostae]
MEELPDYIKKILLRKLHGASAKVDERIIADWVAQRPVRKEEIDQMDATWQQTDEWVAETAFDTTSAWSKVDQRITMAAEKGTGAPVALFRISYLLKIVTAAAIVTGFIFGGWWLHNQRQERFNTITATADQHITLAEGTTVWLRKGSTIRFPKFFFKKQRKISLSGEAYFNVKTAVHQPFSIETQKGMITVLGTSFLVNTGRQERVAVITGKVLFADKGHPQNQCILTAHEEALFSEGTFERKTFTSPQHLWQDELNFRSTPLKEVIQTLTIFYDSAVKIDTTQSPQAGELLITASFGKESLLQAVDELTKLTGLHYKRQQDTIILY